MTLQLWLIRVQQKQGSSISWDCRILNEVGVFCLFVVSISLNTVLMFVQPTVKWAFFFSFLEKNSKSRKEIQTLNQTRKGNFTEYCHCSLKTGRAQRCRKPNHKSHMHRALPVVPERMLHSPLKPPSLHSWLLKPEHHGFFLSLEALIWCSHWGNSASHSTPRVIRNIQMLIHVLKLIALRMALTTTTLPMHFWLL